MICKNRSGTIRLALGDRSHASHPTDLDSASLLPPHIDDASMQVIFSSNFTCKGTKNCALPALSFPLAALSASADNLRLHSGTLCGPTW